MQIEFGVLAAIRGGVSLFIARPLHYLGLGASMLMLNALLLLLAIVVTPWLALIALPIGFAAQAAIASDSVASDLRGERASIGVCALRGLGRFWPTFLTALVYVLGMAVLFTPIFVLQELDPSGESVMRSQWLLAAMILPFVMFVRWLLVSHIAAVEALYPPASYKRSEQLCAGRYWLLLLLFLALLLLISLAVAPFSSLAAAMQPQPGAAAPLDPATYGVTAAMFIVAGAVIQICHNVMAWSALSLGATVEIGAEAPIRRASPGTPQR